jgi:hypothetical protein
MTTGGKGGLFETTEGRQGKGKKHFTRVAVLPNAAEEREIEWVVCVRWDATM